MSMLVRIPVRITGPAERTASVFAVVGAKDVAGVGVVDLALGSHLQPL
ncbi:MAG: hypothetical protein IBX67_04520 [Dehalococcoidia bacterium]|nr:hypothetical protein [Dehalococcoidia bacterium]